ncbi:tryptophan synthase subunit alpha [Longibacter salinarum]|uniref:Tryptophan synthase alpha chain n=1 Tax=Longibacter salinarum TaxID=1850348 RepID=A0A2A8CVW0_9BACT|nr:tryptophan synthase subunit alpha [Longibacter salinarum]PEN12889.1 tryptophan synthase subunit alpha [Longibacter salinarum]
MSRLDKTFADLRDRGEKAMGLFLTNGFPNPDATLPILRAIDEAGVDFVELGMPFSDPLAEGLPIQRSSERALSHGVTMDDAFETAAAFREESDTPLLLMGYVNPVLKYGAERFCERASEAGVDGVILPDVPPEEARFITDAAQRHDLDIVFLIAPNTSDERIQRIDKLASGFVYAVSVTGLTGSSLSGDVDAYLHRARNLVTDNALLVGFGIKTHEDAMELSQHTDGFIVGSALINHCADLWDAPSLSDEERLASVRSFARKLKYGTEAEPA